MITLRKTLIERDSDGALFVRYTPVLDMLCQQGANGELTFAAWDVGVGEPAAAHEAAMDNARANAVAVLRRLADNA